MSRVYFTTKNKEVEIRGSERAYCGGLIADIFVGILDCPEEYGEPSPYRKILKPDSYLLKSRIFKQSFDTSMKVGMEDHLVIDGEITGTFAAQLNTVMRIGNDVMKFICRFHAQSEIHGYVEGANRAWLAGIVQKGLDLEIFRKDAGWETLIEFLQEDDAEPVVMSYSVCESFPNPGAAGWEPPTGENGEKDWDAWYELPDDDRWNMSMEGIRADPWLEMKPDNWNEYFFRDGLDAFKIRKYAYEKRSEERKNV